MGVRSGRTKPKIYWRQLCEALLTGDFLEKSGDIYAVPTITPQGHRLAGGEERFFLLEDQRTEPTRNRGQVAEEPRHPGLFDTLRALRKKLADAAGVPPYVVFGDRTLRAMAGRLPESTEEFARLPGVGQIKIERYGREFLSAVREFTGQNPEVRPMDRVEQNTVQHLRSETFATTLRMLNQGDTVQDIARSRGMAESTIEGHVVKLMQEGEQLNWRQWVPEQTESLLRELFDLHGTKALKPIIESANGAATYTQARILRIVMECGDSSPLSRGSLQ